MFSLPEYELVLCLRNCVYVLSLQVLKVEHDSQKGSIFALLVAIAVVFAIVNIEKVHWL